MEPDLDDCIERIVEKLCSWSILVRDKGKSELFSLLKRIESNLGSEKDGYDRFLEYSEKRLKLIQPKWMIEAEFCVAHGFLVYNQVVLDWLGSKWECYHNATGSLNNWIEFLKESITALSHGDVRIRIVAAETLSCCAKVDPLLQLLNEAVGVVVTQIQDNSGPILTRIHESKRAWAKGIRLACDTLDTSIRCLNIMLRDLPANLCDINEVGGGGGERHPFIELIVQLASKYPNTHVRESSFRLLSKLLSNGTIARNKLSARNQINLGALKECLVVGMSDKCGIVRMAGCFATHQFFIIGEKKTPPLEWEIGDMLLCALGLNRYYPADGIKNQARKTWKTVVGNNGLEVVHTHAETFMTFYEQQLSKSDRFIREAVIHCVAEMASLLDPIRVTIDQPNFLLRMSAMVGIGLNDKEWTVFDVAISIVGTLALRFRYSHPQLDKMTEDYFLVALFAKLSHSYQVVRCGAAVSLCRLLYSLPPSSPQFIFFYINQYIQNGLGLTESSEILIENAETIDDDNVISRCTKCKCLTKLPKQPLKDKNLFTLLESSLKPTQLTQGSIVLLGVMAHYGFQTNPQRFPNISLCTAKTDNIDLDALHCKVVTGLVRDLCEKSVPKIFKLLKEKDIQGNVIWMTQTVFDFFPPLIEVIGKKKFKNDHFNADDLFDILQRTAKLVSTNEKLSYYTECFLKNLDILYGKRILIGYIEQFCDDDAGKVLISLMER